MADILSQIINENRGNEPDTLQMAQETPQQISADDYWAGYTPTGRPEDMWGNLTPQQKSDIAQAEGGSISPWDLGFGGDEKTLNIPEGADYIKTDKILPGNEWVKPINISNDWNDPSNQWMLNIPGIRNWIMGKNALQNQAYEYPTVYKDYKTGKWVVEPPKVGEPAIEQTPAQIQRTFEEIDVEAERNKVYENILPSERAKQSFLSEYAGGNVVIPETLLETISDAEDLPQAIQEALDRGVPIEMVNSWLDESRQKSLDVAVSNFINDPENFTTDTERLVFLRTNALDYAGILPGGEVIDKDGLWQLALQYPNEKIDVVFALGGGKSFTVNDRLLKITGMPAGLPRQEIQLDSWREFDKEYQSDVGRVLNADLTPDEKRDKLFAVHEQYKDVVPYLRNKDMSEYINLAAMSVSKEELAKMSQVADPETERQWAEMIANMPVSNEAMSALLMPLGGQVIGTFPFIQITEAQLKKLSADGYQMLRRYLSEHGVSMSDAMIKEKRASGVSLPRRRF
jgi:hypothetical protein